MIASGGAGIPSHLVDVFREGRADAGLVASLVPIYFGLAIVAEESRLARQPALAAVLDHLSLGPQIAGAHHIEVDLHVLACARDLGESLHLHRDRGPRRLHGLAGLVVDEAEVQVVDEARLAGVERGGPASLQDGTRQVGPAQGDAERAGGVVRADQPAPLRWKPRATG